MTFRVTGWSDEPVFGFRRSIIYDSADLTPGGSFRMHRWIALSLSLLVPAAPVLAAVPWNQDAQQCFELTLPESFQPDKALPYCERAMTDPALTNRNLGGLYYYRGTIWNSKRDYKKAFEDFKKASELDPVLPQARSYLGFTRFFLGDFEPAIYDFAAAYELRNDDIY